MRVTFEQVEHKADECAVIKAIKLTEEIQNAIDLLESGTDSIAVIKDSKTYFCKLSAIYYIESIDKRTYVYTKDACYETKARLYELEEDIGYFFARCAKGMIVNLKKVRNVSAEFGGRMSATLLNDEKIVISRSYVKEIKRRLGI